MPVEQIGGQRAAQLAHDRGRRGSLPDDVPDRHRDPVGVEGQDVVPVPAGLDTAGGGQVLRGQPQTVQVGQGGRKECVLERFGGAAPLVGVHRPLKGLGGLPDQGEREVALVRRELARGGEAGGEDTDHPPGDAQRERDRRVVATGPGVFGQVRIAGRPVGGAVEPDRFSGLGRLRDGHGVLDPESAELSDQVRGITDRVHDFQFVAARPHGIDALGAGREGVANAGDERLGDRLEAVGRGQRGGDLLELALAVRYPLGADHRGDPAAEVLGQRDVLLVIAAHASPWRRSPGSRPPARR